MANHSQKFKRAILTLKRKNLKTILIDKKFIFNFIILDKVILKLTILHPLKVASTCAILN